MSTTTFGWCRDGQDFSCLLHRESCREVSFVLHYTCDCQCRAAKERGFTDEKRTTTRLTLSRLNRFPLQRNWPSLQEICCFLLLSYFFGFLTLCTSVLLHWLRVLFFQTSLKYLFFKFKTKILFLIVY